MDRLHAEPEDRNVKRVKVNFLFDDRLHAEPEDRNKRKFKIVGTYDGQAPCGA